MLVEAVGTKVVRSAQIRGEISDVTGAPARLASFDGDAGLRVPSGEVGRWVDLFGRC